jgi:sec-independent protein translocase protein TatA
MSNTFLGFIGSLGGQELIWIFIIVLLLFGAKKLPELARGVGKSMGEFKKAREEFEREITRSEEDLRRDKEAAESAARVKPASNNETHDA